MKFNLREALTKTGAELDAKQLAFVDAFSTALDERMAHETTTHSESMTLALRTALGEMPKNETGEVETIASQIRAIAENLEKLEKRTVRQLDDKAKFQLRKMLVDKKTEIVEAIRSGSNFELQFEAKRAAGKHTNANLMTDAGDFIMPDNQNYIVDDEVALIRYPENFILNVIRNTQVSKVPQTRIKVEQEPVQGAVAVVAEGGVKPILQYQFVRTTTTRQKYAGRIEWSEEFEMDNERLFSAIVTMFEDQVIREWQDGLLEQIRTNATAYTTSTLDGTLPNPDNGIAAVAAASSISALNYMPDTVIMHPSDVVAMMFTQDADGNWRLVPYLQNGTINGMRLVSSNKMEQGAALIGDSSTYREEHSGFMLRFGNYNDQFIRNEKSAIGEVFSILSIAALDEVSWMEIDLEAVKASLTVGA
jgi:hypothetical protein